MFKEAFSAIGGATRDLLKNWRVLAILTALYLVLLLSIYWFFATGVATAGQLVLSAILVALAPILLFFLQATITNFAVGAERAGELLRRALRDFLKILLISLPLIAFGVLVLYLVNKLHAKFPVPTEDLRRAVPSGASSRAALPPLPMRWQDVSFAALRLFLLGAVLPLAAVHLWIAIARHGLVAALKSIHRVLGRAFMPTSVFVYAIGLFLFGLMPYFIIYTTTPIKNGWLELIIFGMRVAVAFVLTLWGWTITVGALARVAPGAEFAPEREAPAAPPPGEEVPAQA